ncbi:MAG: twin-arginine translocation signal domain-containing protein, partial [Verrucomicrobiia bacterium]
MNTIKQGESNTTETSNICPASTCGGCAHAGCAARMSRRRFLEATAAAGGWLMGASSFATSEAVASLSAPKVKIYTVYLGGAGAWPKPEFDAPAEKAKFEKFIAKLMPKFPEVELVGGDLVVSAKEAVPKIAARDDVAGVLCI